MLLIAFVMVFGFTVSARATLIENLDGTITGDDFGIICGLLMLTLQRQRHLECQALMLMDR